MAVSWLKKGSDSAALQKQDEQDAKQREAQHGKLFRFFLKHKEEAKLTFVDGELSPEGFLIPPRFYEHMIEQHGKWNNYICPEKTNPESGEICPICKGGDRPSLISLFTVIDHRGFTRKDGSVVPFSVKLLAVKTGVMELLAKQAIKRGGLAGCTFEVSRMGPQAAAVGDVWDFVEKGDLTDLVNQFMVKRKDEKGVESMQTLFSPADYEKELVYYTAQELMQMGLGGAPHSYVSPGGNKPTPGASNQAYKDAL